MSGWRQQEKSVLSLRLEEAVETGTRELAGRNVQHVFTRLGFCGAI